jgi:hypothetical protein
MWIAGRNLTVKNDEGDTLFDDISFSFGTGEFAMLATDDTQKAVTFSMLATGRLRKYKGIVSIISDDGAERKSIFGLRDIRKMTAVPFVPVIGEPDEFLKAWQVLKEEFLFAGKSVSRRFALDYMAGVIGGEARDMKSLRVKDLTIASRMKIFTGLAAMRPGVKFIFVTLPERYGGLPDEWVGTLKEAQTEDNAVVLITTKLVAGLLGEPYYDLDRGMELCGHAGD